MGANADAPVKRTHVDIMARQDCFIVLFLSIVMRCAHRTLRRLLKNVEAQYFLIAFFVKAINCGCYDLERLIFNRYSLALW